MRIIFPKCMVEIDRSYGPLFFLAGPVKGGDDWQLLCSQKIREQIPHFYAALPCPRLRENAFKGYQVQGVGTDFERQLLWEHHYLTEAAKSGCVLFWLPCESKVRPRLDGEYARDTRGELGDWRTELKYNPNFRVVVGAEPEFPGLGVIKRGFDIATKSDFPIYGSLQETIIAAIEKAS